MYFLVGLGAVTAAENTEHEDSLVVGNTAVADTGKPHNAADTLDAWVGILVGTHTIGGANWKNLASILRLELQERTAFSFTLDYFRYWLERNELNPPKYDYYGALSVGAKVWIPSGKTEWSIGGGISYPGPFGSIYGYYTGGTGIRFSPTLKGVIEVRRISSLWDGPTIYLLGVTVRP